MPASRQVPIICYCTTTWPNTLRPPCENSVLRHTYLNVHTKMQYSTHKNSPSAIVRPAPNHTHCENSPKKSSNSWRQSFSTYASLAHCASTRPRRGLCGIQLEECSRRRMIPGQLISPGQWQGDSFPSGGMVDAPQ